MNDVIQPESVSKAMLGLVDSIDRVFTGLRYVRSVVTPGKGSYRDKDRSEIFISLRGVPGAPATFDERWRALVATPAVDVPPGTLRIGSISCIEWRGTGMALVTVSDPTYIGSTWLAFAPVESIAKLKPA